MGGKKLVSAKYIIHSRLKVDGVVDKPDVVGAIFGQTEGLLGEDLELRDLQDSGKVGRIEVDLRHEEGKTKGEASIPSSLNKTRTAILASSLETIERVGPSSADFEIERIEDVRKNKRKKVKQRAKELLKQMEENSPGTKEIERSVEDAIGPLKIRKYGRENLPAGPHIRNSGELIVVEGRADVLNLLNHGIGNVIATNGSSVPHSLKKLSDKTITALVDGDRGGSLILRELDDITGIDVDYIARAPEGKEVEDLNDGEIKQTLKNKKKRKKKARKEKINELGGKKLERFRKLKKELSGERKAVILDSDLEEKGRVPVGELKRTLARLNKAHAVVLDGYIDGDLIKLSEKTGVKYLIGNEKRADSKKIKVFENGDL